MTAKRTVICPACLQLAGNVCAVCGKPIPVGQVMCSDCAKK